MACRYSNGKIEIQVESQIVIQEICHSIIYSDHSVMQMFKRNIQLSEVQLVLNSGIIIQNYPDDKPFPSSLILGFADGKPIHLVVAFNELEASCIIVTAYHPDQKIWDKDFKKKIN